MKIQMQIIIAQTIVFFSVLALGITFLSFHQEYFRLHPQTNHERTLFLGPNPFPKPTLSSQPFPPPEVSHDSKPTNLTNDVNDDELFLRASLAPGASEVPSNFTAKIAFMFLVRRDVKLGPLWERFFRGHEGLYSVYLHSDPSSNATVPETSVFYGRRVPSKAVKWGEISMVEAERRLLGNALLDPANQRFVLLSETCIPLFNFSTVYTYLTNTAKSFVEAYDGPGKTGLRYYKAQMHPLITPATWRKGSQWFALARSVAHAVVTDDEYFPLFKTLCRGRCLADEHYLPTFLSAELAGESANRALTWVDWADGGAHPRRFVRGDVTVELLKRLRHGGECEYEGRRTDLCHLFARKFLPNTLDRLLRFAPKIMQFS